jgi:hypothetical protein
MPRISAARFFTLLQRASVAIVTRRSISSSGVPTRTVSRSSSSSAAGETSGRPPSSMTLSAMM